MSSSDEERRRESEARGAEGNADGDAGATASRLGMAATLESTGGRTGPQPRPRVLPPGTMLDAVYRVEDLIGRGGMGAVYMVEHTALGRRFAAKVLTEAQTSDEEAIQRLQQEARAASAIDHENIVDVTHLGQSEDGVFFVVMELLRGENLGQRIERAVAEGAPIPEDETREVVAQVLRGLGAAHAAGIVHRDLKPENVFLAERRGRVTPKIVDFGISKLQRSPEEMRLTRTGQLLGTPLYMAPEQSRGGAEEIDGRADLYSLGIIAYEMLTGQHPFPSETLYEILMKHATVPPPPPSEVGATVPPAVEAVVLRSLAKHADERFASAEEMLGAWLDAWDGVLPPPAPETSGPWSAPSEAGRTSTASEGPEPSGGPGARAPLLAAGLAVLLVGAVGAWWVTAGAGDAAGAAAAGASGEPADGLAVAAEAPAGAVAAAEPEAAAGDAEEEPGPAVDEAPAPTGVDAPATRPITLETSPPGAAVREDGELLGTTPLELEVVEGEVRSLKVVRRGYRPATVSLDDEAEARVVVELDRAPRPSRPPGLGGLAPR